MKAVIGPDPHHQTDKELKRHIRHILSADYGVDLDKIQVQVCEGAVSIEGVVPEGKLAHITQKICESGAKDIQNLLRAE